MKTFKVTVFLLFGLIWLNGRGWPGDSTRMTSATQTQERVLRSLSYTSKALGGDVKFSVYLPENYFISKTSYPGLYFFHGMTDDENSWFDKGKLPATLDKMISQKKIKPVIAIIPDGGFSFFINNHNNSVKWETFFVKEFIPYIEKTFRIKKGIKKRGLIGISMGGYGVLLYLLKYPDLFKFGIAYSPAILSKEFVESNSTADWNWAYSKAFGVSKVKSDRFTKHFNSYSPLKMIKRVNNKLYHDVSIIIDCGNRDFLFTDNNLFQEKLKKYMIDHVFITKDGGHGWGYWKKRLYDGLKLFNTFIDK